MHCITYWLDINLKFSKKNIHSHYTVKLFQSTLDENIYILPYITVINVTISWFHNSECKDFISNSLKLSLTFLYSLNVVLAYFSNENVFPIGLGGWARRRKSFIKKPTNSLPLLAWNTNTERFKKLSHYRLEEAHRVPGG